MIRRVVYAFVLVLLFIGFGFGGVWYKTPSNTLVWEEDFSSSLHLDAYNSYIGAWGGGARNNTLHLWSWDGPIVDIVVDRVNSRVYTVGELNVHSALVGNPFVNQALFRYDVYVNKLNYQGQIEWPLSVSTRSNTNESALAWDNGGSKYPTACVDSSGNVYVAYFDNRGGVGLYVSKVSPSGVLLWETYVTDSSDYQAGIVFSGGFVFVAHRVGNNIRVSKINATTGNIVSSAQVNTSGAVNYYPDIAVGPDGYLYVVWLNDNNGNFNVLGQRLDANLNRVNWGGNTSDKVINAYTNYGNAYYWYPGEETVSVYIDGYDLYVAFKLYHRGFARSKVFLQKINFSGGNFTRAWSSDVLVGRGTSQGVYHADAYPDLVVVGDYVFVVWINHGPTENDHAFLQKIDKVTGQMVWDRDVNLYDSALISHHARIATDGAFLYVISANPNRNVAKLDQFGNVIYNVDVDFVEGRRRFNNYATFRTKNLISPDNITGFVPIEAKVMASFSELPSNATVSFLLSPETNVAQAHTNYITLTNNQTGSFVNQKGNVFMYLILNNKPNEGTNRIVITNLKVEFTQYYFSDGMVGRLPSGGDRVGLNLIRGVNDFANGQLVNDFTYNDGVSSAKGYWYFVNNGTTSRSIRIRADGGTTGWTVRYFLCVYTNGEWVTNQEITSTLTSGGFVTNLSPYLGGNSNIVVVRVFLTPSTSLSSGDNYTVRGFVDTQLPSGGWVLSDVVGFRGIVSSAKPDLRISRDGINYLGYDVINSDGSDQTIELKMNVNVEKVAYVYLRNLGGNDNIKIVGTGGDDWWKVEYRFNNIDITSYIVSGQFNIPLGYGEEFGPIVVKFSPTNSSVPINVPKNILIKGISTTDPSKEDVVKFIIRPVVSKVELIVRKSNDSSWVGAGVFSQDYSQRVSNRIDNGLTNYYEVSLTNLGSYTEEIIVRASNRTFASGWKVFYLFGGNDITTVITNQGFVITNLSPSNVGSNIVIGIVSPSSYPVGANEVMGVFVEAIPEADTNVISKRDTVAIYDTLVSTRVDGIIVSSLYGSQGYNVITSVPTAQALYSYTYSNSVYTVILSNPSPSDFEFRVRITNANNIQWRISVSNGGSDITTLITNISGWTTPTIPSGGTFSLSLFVSSTNEYTGLGANVGDTNRVVVLVNSPLRSDVVDRLMVYVEKALPPDILVRKTNETLYRGGNVFSTNAVIVNQVVNHSYPNDDTTYKEGLFRIRNLRPIPENVFVKVSEVEKDNVWDYKIYRYVGPNINNPDFSNPSHWSDVTVSITNTGQTNSITNGSDVLYRIQSKPVDATNNNDKITLRFSATGLDTKWVDIGEFKITFGIGIPDIYACSGEGKGVLDTNYNISVTNFFDKALGDFVRLVVSNQNNDISGVFTLRGDGNKGQWEIRYYSSDTNDITSIVLGDGYTFNVSPSGVYDFFVKVKAIEGSTYSFGEITNFGIRVENDQGGFDTINLVSIITDRGIPDIYITGAWSNVFENVPSSQIQNIYIGKGDSLTNYIYLANWRTEFETNMVYISRPSIPDFYIKVERLVGSSWIDVTSEITNEGVKHKIYTDGIKEFRVILTVDSNTVVPLNTLQEVDIELISQGRLKVDKAKFRYILTDMGRPDIYYISSTITNGRGVYETTPNLQIQDIEIEKGVSNTVILSLGNERSKNESMRIWSSGYVDPKFVLSFHISTNEGVSWSNITSLITSSTGCVIPILANSNVLLRIDSFLRVDSTNNIDDVLSVDFRLYSWIGVSNDNFRIRYVVKDKNRPDILVSTIGSNIFFPIPQRISNFVEKGSSITQEITLMNAKDDRTSDFILEGSGGFGDWTVKYLLDGVDITSAVISGGYTISSVPPLGGRTLNVVVSLASNSTYTLSSNISINLKLFSYTRLVRDEFGIIVRVEDFGRPDVLLVDNHDGVYYPSFQSITNRIEKGEYITNYFYVQNDRGDKDEAITVLFEWDTNASWWYNVSVFDGYTWNEITSYVSNEGYVEVIPSTTIITGRIVIRLNDNADIPSGEFNSIRIKALSQGKLREDICELKVLVVDPRPDLSAISLSGEVGRVGDDKYESSVNVSVDSMANGYVMYIQPARYSIILENDDVVDDSFVIKASGNLYVPNKWQVVVKDRNESDVTTFITNIGITNRVSGSESLIYIVEVKLINPDNVRIGESNEVYFEVRSVKNPTRVDYVKLITERVEVNVSGKVIEAVSGNGVKDAIVEVYESRTKSLIKTLITDNNGRFSTKLIPTTYRFVVKKDRYLVFEKELTIPEVLEHNLEDFALIRFNVKDEVLDIHSFPNPVDSGGTIRIVVNIPQKSSVKIYVMNMSGNVLKKFVDGNELDAGKYSFEWNLRADDGTILKRGIYLLVISDGRDVIIRRIMIK